MRIQIDIPKNQPRLSLDIDVDEEKLKEGAEKLLDIIKQKFPFKIKVKSG
jgi:hypothetical protein